MKRPRVVDSRASARVIGVLALACACVSSCESSGDSGAAANSATAKWCADFNNLSCQRTFECTPEAEKKEPFFVALFGNSASECAKRWADLCRNPKPDIEADVTCRDGWSVDEAKATMCLNRVRSATCMEIEDEATRAPCADVCKAGGGSGGSGGTAGTGGTGGAGGSAGTGGSGGASSGTENEKFCRDTMTAFCGRVFACYGQAERESPTFKQIFGTNVAECTTLLGTECYAPAVNMCTLNRSQAQICLTAVGAISCTALMAGNFDLPPACDLACPAP